MWTIRNWVNIPQPNSILTMNQILLLHPLSLAAHSLSGCLARRLCLFLCFFWMCWMYWDWGYARIQCSAPYLRPKVHLIHVHINAWMIVNMCVWLYAPPSSIRVCDLWQFIHFKPEKKIWFQLRIFGLILKKSYNFRWFSFYLNEKSRRNGPFTWFIQIFDCQRQKRRQNAIDSIELLRSKRHKKFKKFYTLLIRGVNKSYVVWLLIHT